MSFFGYARFNARLLVPAGTASQPGLSIGAPGAVTGSYSGIYAIGSNPAMANTGTGLMAWFPGVVQLSSATQLAWAVGALNTASDAVLLREAVGQLGVRQGTASTAAGDLLLRDVYFQQTASTFGSAATITNGPRAANPVAWVEVAVAGSTGRIPVW